MTNGLPCGWVQATIGDIADVQLGRQRSPQHHSGNHMRPYLRAANVTWNGISLDDVKEMNFDDRDFETYRLEPGDLLLNEASGSPNEVGKPAIWRGEIEDCCFQNTLLRLRTRGIDLGYLYWYCFYSALTGRFGEAGRGVNIRHIGKQGLTRFPIAVAPRAEQERIVAAIGEHFSRLDAAEASIADAEAKCAALPSIAMSRLFSPKWPKCRLDTVAQVGSGATPKRSDTEYWSHGTIPWVTSGAVNQTSIWSADEFISERALAETSVKLWPTGTVLMAMYGEGKTRGKAAVLEFESTCNQACAAINYDRSILDGRFLRTFLNVQYEANRRLSSGGVQPNLNLGLVKAMEVPVPSLQTQASVAIQAEEIVSASVELLAACVTARRRVSALRRSVLVGAFAGRLVPPDPANERVSASLCRSSSEKSTR